MDLHIQDEASPASEVDTTDANIVEAPSSPAPEQDANSASSSAAETGGKPETSLFDAVNAALEEGAKADAPPASDQAKEGKPDPKKGDEADAAADAEAEAEIPQEFHKHPAWQRLKTQRDEFKAPAEQYAKIETFMRQQNLAPNEIVEGYKVMALIKNKPAEALEILQGYVTALSRDTGTTLPDDLAHKVRVGQIDEATAQELSRERANNRTTRSQLEHRQQEEAKAETLRVQTSARDAVATWEARVKVQDPDYASKEALVQDRILAIVQSSGRYPKTEADALSLAKTAYADVNKYLASFSPTRQATVPHPRSSSSSNSPQPQPASLAEAIQQAVGG